MTRWTQPTVLLSVPLPIAFAPFLSPTLVYPTLYPTSPPTFMSFPILQTLCPDLTLLIIKGSRRPPSLTPNTSTADQSQPPPSLPPTFTPLFDQALATRIKVYDQFLLSLHPDPSLITGPWSLDPWIPASERWGDPTWDNHSLWPDSLYRSPTSLYL